LLKVAEAATEGIEEEAVVVVDQLRLLQRRAHHRHRERRRLLRLLQPAKEITRTVEIRMVGIRTEGIRTAEILLTRPLVRQLAGTTQQEEPMELTVLVVVLEALGLGMVTVVITAATMVAETQMHCRLPISRPPATATAEPMERKGKRHRRRKSDLSSDRTLNSHSYSDPANFINFCTGKTKTNGLQVKAGSCNGIGKLV
jgi:hypothetical protein